jgi:tRNA(fMet)-specific endonuclease VapC
MRQYLLDTDTCIHFLRGRYGISEKIAEVGMDNCFVSEITVAELFFGAANSQNPNKHFPEVEQFEKSFKIIPIYKVLKAYANEKVRLRTAGTPVTEFDLLIGVTAREHGLVLVTGNEKHLGKIKDLKIENWTLKTFNPHT